MRDLKWEDVTRHKDPIDGDVISLKVKGKTGLREAVLNPGAEQSLKRLFDLRREELDDVGSLSINLIID